MSARPRLFKAITLLVLLFVVGSLGLTFSAVPLHANPASFSFLFGRINSPAGWGFTSSTVSSPGPDITVQPGETLDPIITSGDGITHNWGVDYNGNGFPDSGEPLSNNTSTSTSFTFTATTTPGVYTYWCFIHKGPMNGRFIVQGPDFRITPNPSSLTIIQGLSQTSTLTVSSLNGFSGTVIFSSPSTPAGIMAALSASSVSVGPSTPGTTILNVTVGSSTNRAQYTVSVTGSGGGNTHTAAIDVVVVGPDFVVNLSQSSMNLVVGSSGNATVTLMSQNGFAGKVNLTATVSPPGPTLSFNPATVTLTSGGSATSTLTIGTTSGLYSSTGLGTYAVTVTATGSPSLSHSVTLSVAVIAQPSSPTGNIPVAILVIAGVAILAAVLIVVYVVLRRKPRK